MKTERQLKAAHSMISCLNRALISVKEHGHDFGGSISLATDKPLNKDPAPKLSQAGQYYLDCLKCGRTVFEDGTGSATQSGCKPWDTRL